MVLLRGFCYHKPNTHTRPTPCRGEGAWVGGGVGIRFVIKEST